MSLPLTDPKQIIEIRDLIKSLKQKHTVILSSHILSEVSAVCDYVLIISHGKLVASDTPDNLSKLAAGANNINLLAKGEKDNIRQHLLEIPGVKDITIDKKAGTEGWNITVSTEENIDIREDIFIKWQKIIARSLRCSHEKFLWKRYSWS